jgi:transketolase
MSPNCNGLGLHGGIIPYSGTFLTISDNARNAQRMAALMKEQNIFVYTHDSIGLGEDGPTHQPVEHVASLRIMPNMRVWRPCDTVENMIAWRNAIERNDGPTSLVLTRQNVPHQSRSQEQVDNISRGGYILHDCDGTPELLLIATGSEVSLAVDAAAVLAGSGIAVRVVSMPCTDLFHSQPEQYRRRVLPADVAARVVVEAGVSETWWRIAGPGGRVIGLDRFGESAPAEQLFENGAGFVLDEHSVVSLRDYATVAKNAIGDDCGRLVDDDDVHGATTCVLQSSDQVAELERAQAHLRFEPDSDVEVASWVRSSARARPEQQRVGDARIIGQHLAKRVHRKAAYSRAVLLASTP